MPKGQARAINNKDKGGDKIRRRWRSEGSPLGKDDDPRMYRNMDALGRDDYKTKGTGLKSKVDKPESYNSGNAPTSSGRRRPGDDKPKSSRKRPGK